MDSKYKKLILWLIQSLETRNYIGVKEVLETLLKEIDEKNPKTGGKRNDYCS